MTREEQENATIKSVTFGIEDHGILTANLGLDFGSCWQGFGGWCLHSPGATKPYPPTDFAGWWICRLLQTLEVSEWSKLQGINVRARRRDGLLYAIGHIVKDQWFSPREEWEKHPNNIEASRPK